MPNVDHRAPVSLCEVFSTNAVDEHGLDLWEVGSPYGVLVHERPARRVGIIAVVSPALTGGDSEELLDDPSVPWRESALS